MKMISRSVNETGWRESVYERPDGTRFHVALPPRVDMITFDHRFDEAAEVDMRQALNRKEST